MSASRSTRVKSRSPVAGFETSDEGPAETALREAEEEIGLDRACVDLIGFIDCYCTNKGFCVAPAIAVVTPGFTLKIDSREVAEVFEVPLRFLMTAENHEFHERIVEGSAATTTPCPIMGAISGA